MGLRQGLGIALVLCVPLVAACTQTRPLLHPSLTEYTAPGAARVLLMPPDVELSELTTVGLEEPRADWTEAASVNVRQAVHEVLAAGPAQVVEYGQPDDPFQLLPPEHLQLIKLHNAVAGSILLHAYFPRLRLPTKPRFEWTLGAETTLPLAQATLADHALFVVFRDSYSSGGRVALMAVGALFGAAVPGGRQIGFASLVDLRSGQIVWFNRLSSDTGDLRDLDSAVSAVDSLLQDIPVLELPS